MKKRNLDSGLSLLETLVALAVMAMLATILSSGIGFGLRSLGQEQKLTDEIQFALDRRQLRDWFEHAIASPSPDGRVLIGTRSTVSFRSDMATSNPFFDQSFPILVAMTNGSSRFIATSSAPDQPKQSTMELVTAHPTTEVTVEYWGRRKPDLPPGWDDEWSVAGTLPNLVRIAFNGSDLPPMIVQPGKAFLQSEMSLSSLVPPALPSRP